MKATFARWCLLQLSLAARQRAAKLDAEQPRPTQVKEFRLARDEGTHIAFVPSAPATSRHTRPGKANGPRFKIQLVRPDGSVAADAIGVGQVTMLFNIRRGEFTKNHGEDTGSCSSTR